MLKDCLEDIAHFKEEIRIHKNMFGINTNNNTTDNDIHNIGAVEAARYLQIPYIEFIGYVNQGLVTYKLPAKTKLHTSTERFFSRKELHRFQKEYLLDNRFTIL